MIPVYFHTETDAVLAAKALPASMPATAPTMVEPFHGRPWVIEVDVDPSDTRDFQVALQVAYRYQGEVHQAPLTTRPGGAPFMNRMPQSVIDRYNAENPQQAQHTAAKQPLRFEHEHDEDTGIVHAYLGDEYAGHLLYNVGFGGNTGTVDTVFVQPEHRRRGIARAMFDHVVGQGVDLSHNTSRTDEGDAWARGMGADPREYRLDDTGQQPS